MSIFVIRRFYKKEIFYTQRNTHGARTMIHEKEQNQ